MRWTWIVCVGVAVGCGPAVETPGGTEIEAETDAGTAEGSTGARTTSVSMVPEPDPTDPNTSSSEGTGPSGVTTDGVTMGGVTTGAPSMDGEFFLAIFATPVAPTTPFQFLADVKADAGQVVMLLTPLSLDVGSVSTPREPVPPSFEVSGSIDAGGAFRIEVPELALPGSTNPITGSDIVASLTLEGVLGIDRICGRVSGMITVPANIDLTGSTLAGERSEGDPLPLPADLDCDQ